MRPSKLTMAEKQALLRRAQSEQTNANADVLGWADDNPLGLPEDLVDFRKHPAYQQVALMRDGARRLGVDSPFFRLHEGIARAHSRIAGRSVINFASYNYLDLAGHPEVLQAAQKAIQDFGTTVSASRIVSGERPFHRALERALADFYAVDDALTFVSGHATNVSVIGHLLGPRDLIVHDEYAHNSILVGARLSGAQRLPFPHNDLDGLEALLRQHRRKAERCLVAVEGLYSMDGDSPELGRLIDIKRRYRSWLMVDEAHSLGVLGARGRGLAEQAGVPTAEVDIWMGTLSKTLASCGGYVAGSQPLIDQLRFLAPGFLYSVGLSPALGAAALRALEILQREPERCTQLQENSAYFLAAMRAMGLDTGTSKGTAIIPWITGSSLTAVQHSAALLERGINVQPILYPAVPEQRARLRFFLSSAHHREDLDRAMIAIAGLLSR
ncbi:MAG: aminotransferase class I/II-fold pyridoxal phosphate-dependent enzyme [Acidithiobacillus sp.]